VSWVALTKVVASPSAFQKTVEEGKKFVPPTVRVNAAPPAVAEIGEIPVTVGIGYVKVKPTLAVKVPPEPVHAKT
jgi:hypothetical protein